MHSFIGAMTIELRSTKHMDDLCLSSYLDVKPHRLPPNRPDDILHRPSALERSLAAREGVVRGRNALQEALLLLCDVRRVGGRVRYGGDVHHCIECTIMCKFRCGD